MLITVFKTVLNLDQIERIERYREALFEVIEPNGPLDQYLRSKGADPKTATVYLFGSGATGRVGNKDLLRVADQVCDLVNVGVDSGLESDVSDIVGRAGIAREGWGSSSTTASAAVINAGSIRRLSRRCRGLWEGC